MATCQMSSMCRGVVTGVRQIRLSKVRQVYYVRDVRNKYCVEKSTFNHYSTAHSVSALSAKENQKMHHWQGQTWHDNHWSNGRLGLQMAAVLAGLFSLKKKEEEDEDPLVLTLKKAQLAEMKHEFPKAEALYHEALAELYKQEAAKTINAQKVLESKTYIFDRMANSALAHAQAPKAEALFKDTLKCLLQRGFDKDSNAVVEVSMKVAMTHALQRKYDEAEQGYKFCTDTMVDKLDQLKSDGKKPDEDTLALAGMVHDAYSRYLILRNRAAEAVKISEQALSMAKQVYGEKHPQIAILLSDMATSLAMMQKYKEAEQLVRQSIDIVKGSDSPDLPVFYCNLGLLQMEQGDLQESQRTCTHALKLAQKLGLDSATKQAHICLRQIKSKKG